ncbi:MAG: hypothetical protein COA63_011215 [Methylophaga sp.]|nr:hypothetical protein [Methylophaga sp.]
MLRHKTHRKLVLSSLFIASLLSSFTGMTASNQTESNHNSSQYNTVDSCSIAIDKPVPDDFSAALNSDKITLISWNIEKGHNTGWKRALKNIARKSSFSGKSYYIECQQDELISMKTWLNTELAVIRSNLRP